MAKSTMKTKVQHVRNAQYKGKMTSHGANKERVVSEPGMGKKRMKREANAETLRQILA